ncbi:hypothetical protein [uncultured Vibrio sp.]|uniref:hypothetical protein n=1 Tax=uncultured Vibrio sp. TaxID=114054 RepID=UPI002626D198|nr:hypothetical protein [uncultured Vibrio sp.]
MVNLINVSNAMPFGLLFVNYSLLLGLAGGLGLAWALFSREDDKSYLIPAVAIVLTCGGILNVLAEVQQAGHLIYGFIAGWENWNGSIIKYGVPLLPIYIGLLLSAILITSTSYRRFLPAIKVAIAAVGTFTPAYSGIWMMSIHGVAIWNTPFSPLLTALAGGFFIYGLLTKHDSSERQKITGLFALLSFGAICLGTWWMSKFASVEVSQSMQLINQHFWGVKLLTALTGIAMLLTALIANPSRLWRLAGAVLAMVFGYTTRYLLLVAGEGVSRSGAGLSLFLPDAHELFFTAASLIFMGGIFAVLLLLIPVTDKWLKEL